MPDRAERGPELQGIGRTCQAVVSRAVARKRCSEETDIAPPLGIPPSWGGRFNVVGSQEPGVDI